MRLATQAGFEPDSGGLHEEALAGEVALVTGGGSGLGRAGALELSRAGAGARALVAGVREAGAREKVAAITCAGGVAWPGRDGFTPDIDPADWDEVIRINLSSVFYCAHAAIPVIAAAGGGSIINTAQSMARLPLGALDAYAASKGGVALLTQSLAPGCGRLGVRVNAICPGYVDTPMNALIWGNDALKQAFDRGHATGLQTPEEIAEFVVFLASDASRSLTGAVRRAPSAVRSRARPAIGVSGAGRAFAAATICARTDADSSPHWQGARPLDFFWRKVQTPTPPTHMEGLRSASPPRRASLTSSR